MYVDESSPPPGSPEVEPRVDAPIAEEPTDGDAPVEEDAGATEDGADVTEGTEEGGEEDQTEAEGGEGAGEDAPAPEPAEPDAEAPEPDDAKADDAGEEPAEPAGEGETPPEEGAPPETPETPEPAIQTPEFVLQPRRVALRMCEKSLPADATDAECVYFLKDSAEQAVDTPEALAMHVQHGSLSEGPSLQTLDQMLAQVYLPLLSAADASAADTVMDADSFARTLRELESGTGKFTSQVANTVRQLREDVHLDLPDVGPLDDVGAAAEDDAAVGKIEVAATTWSATLQSTMAAEKEKAVIGRGPLGEIEFWRDRNAALSSLFEQLNTPRVRRMVEVMEKSPLVGAKTIEAFRVQFAELTKMYIETKDNVKFLTTLERHFKAISHYRQMPGGDLQTVLDALSPMINALRMVWIISHHYSDDQRMGGLMLRIATEIGDRIIDELDVEALFTKMPTKEAMAKVDIAKKTAEAWRSTYMSMREKIEQQGRDARWEFDAKTLFARTDYIAGICGDLHGMLGVIEGFNKFLGPQLKAVTGDPEGIDAMLDRVRGMTKLVVDVDFDVFDKKTFSDWADVDSDFESEKEAIERSTKELIDESFKKLSNAEGAFDLMQNFKAMESEGAIGRAIEGKMTDILEQFTKEIVNMRQLFDKDYKAPLVYRGQPPVAGAIAWSRSLFSKIRKTMNKFQRDAEREMRTEPAAAVATRKYTDFAKVVMKYEKKLYGDWVEIADRTALRHLKDPILIVDDETGRMKCNFSLPLHAIIKESDYLSEMNFEIPEVAMKTMLAEDHFIDLKRAIQGMLELYHEAVDLTDVEKSLYSVKLDELRTILQPGFHPLNWNSLGIFEYCERCTNAINEFTTLVNQVNKSSGIIEDIIKEISTTEVIVEPPHGEELLDMQEMCEFIEKGRREIVDRLVGKYRSIGPLLGKVEEAVAGTNTGSSPQLRDYYAHWEKEVLEALNAMVLASLEGWVRLIIHRDPANAEALGYVDGYKNSSKLSLLKMNVYLNTPELGVQPPIKEARLMMTTVNNNILESIAPFVRWLENSCVESPPMPNPEDEDEPIIFNFLPEVSKNEEIITTMGHIEDAVRDTIDSVAAFVDGWNDQRHAVGGWDSSLWKTDKEVFVEKMLDRKPTVEEFEETFRVYTALAEEIGAYAGDRTIHFVKVVSVSLGESLKRECADWIKVIGREMDRVDSERVARISTDLADKNTGIHIECNTLDDLKSVLKIIAWVRNGDMEMELEYTDVEERFQTRRIYDVGMNEDVFNAAFAIRGTWAALQAECEKVDDTLADRKVHFTEVTVKQVEKFTEAVKEFQRRLAAEGPGIPDVVLDEGLVSLDRFIEEFDDKTAMKDELTVAEKLFNLPVTSYPELDEVSNELDVQKKIYAVYSAHLETIKQLGESLFAELDMKKLFAFTDDFKGRIKEMSTVKELAGAPVFAKVAETIEGFKDSLPLIENLKSDALRDRHWKSLIAVTGQDPDFNTNPATFKLADLFGMELHKFRDDVLQLCVAAEKELKIEADVAELSGVWRDQKFELMRYVKGDVDKGNVLKTVDEITLVIEDMALTLQSMLGSRFVKPFLQDVQSWEKKLSLIAEVIEIWMEVQRKWMYLESIFIGSEDIREQLPEEAKRFDRIDRDFKEIMEDTSKNTNILECCSVKGRLEKLQDIFELLERCQKSLSDYLDVKRNAFPRFFYISDDELLSILGTSDPTSVQEHMLKLYDNCAELKFGRGNKTVVGMVSAEGESYDFKSPCKAEGAVEEWMDGVQKEMLRSLRLIAKEGVFYYAKKRRDQWIKDELGMITLAGSQIWWTWEVEDVFQRVRKGDKMAMKNFANKLSGQLVDLTDMVRGDLTNNDRKKVNCLIIIDVHARDIIDNFVRDSVLDAREFAWESQLRFSWDRHEDDIVINQCTGRFNFGYEYMGLNGRLVITGLTDRCYMTITTALTYMLGAAPAGPAGTGKTETTKDLAKSMALLCVVFNCGEGLDYKAMGMIFSGLVQTGAWGCFDEFNRITLEVLSVVSSQVKSIQEALKNKLTEFLFEGKEMKLVATTGNFITMNPGYAGRSELPDNLKALFRPIAMIVPDLQQICEIMLFSEGFNTARVLAKKMTVLYKLAKEQLSKQFHYDFGLRALKSVLVMAGALKRGSPDLDEGIVLMRALRDMNLPKFVFDDVPLFMGLISDLFPGLDCPRVRYPELNDIIEGDLEENGYKVMVNTSEQVDKVVQLYETMLTRHTTMVVGNTGGGKSVIINTLARSQTKMGRHTKIHVVNPKAQSVAELYGEMDPETRDWTDGVLSNHFRTLCKPLPPGRDEVRWIVFDGDVDAVWVENMNSVMDDNKLLTLPNGERIRLVDHCKLLFEVADLQYASPATISRCGMVYVDPKNLEYEPFMWKWCNSRPEAQAKVLRVLFDKYMKKCIDYCLEGVDGEVMEKPLALTVPQTNLNLVTQCCNMLDCLLTEEVSAEIDDNSLEAVFIFCLVWSVGAAVIQKPGVQDRDRFDNFVKRTAEFMTYEGEGLTDTQLPKDSLYEYCFDLKRSKWYTWKSMVTALEVKDDAKFATILVPTVDTVRSAWLLDTFSAAGKPVLFVGDSGTAKTVTINKYLGGLDPEKNVVLNMNFSSRTTSMDVQSVLEGSVEKRTKDTFGPAMGKRMLLYFDDLNMPKVDLYGTQQPIALLKTLIERSGVYDRGKELNWKKMKDLFYVAAMGPPGGARNPVDPRFISLFSTFEIQFPSENNLRTIYASILKSHVVKLSDEIQNAAENLTDVTLQLYNFILDKLPPTPSRFHYIFNLRDLSRIYEGLLCATDDKLRAPGTSSGCGATRRSVSSTTGSSPTRIRRSW